MPGRIDNIGVISTYPAQILIEYLWGKNIFEIISLFWNDDVTQITLLDICTLMQMWWADNSISAGRYSLIQHPDYHSSEIILDKQRLRAIIEFRQPDIDGKHWKASHIHIIRGEIDQTNDFSVIKPNFKRHINLYGSPINGYYIIKVK